MIEKTARVVCNKCDRKGRKYTVTMSDKDCTMSDIDDTINLLAKSTGWICKKKKGSTMHICPKCVT